MSEPIVSITSCPLDCLGNSTMSLIEVSLINHTACMHQFPGEWCWVFQISYRSRKVSMLSCRKSTKFLNSFVPFFSVSKPYFLYVCLTYLHICGLCREGGHSIWKPPFCNWLTNWLFLLLIPSFVFPQPAMVTSLPSRPPAKSPTPRYSDVTLWR